MTTPSSYQTANRIIQYAYMDAGIIGKTATPTSEQLAEGMNRLNDIINLWQTQGLKLWLISDTSVTLVAGQNKYVFSPTGDIVMTKPLKALQGYWLDSNSIRTPLNVLSWEEWLRLSQVTAQGALNSYFVDKQATHLDVYFWNTPDATAALGTAHVLLKQQVTNFVALTDTMNFPLEWAIALRWGLADDLATGQPQEIVDRCEKRAVAYRMALEEADVEDATMMLVPDARLAAPSEFI